MGILEKARRIAEANIQNLIDASPNPAGALKRLLLECEDTKGALKREIGELEARAADLGREHTEAVTLVEHWINRSRMAETKGRTDLAGGAAARFTESARDRDRIKSELAWVNKRLAWLRDEIERVKERKAVLKQKRRDLEGETGAGAPSTTTSIASAPPRAAGASPASDAASAGAVLPLEPVSSDPERDDQPQDPLEAAFRELEASGDAGPPATPEEPEDERA